MADHGFADGRPVPVAHETNGESSLLERYCLEFGKSEQVAMEEIQFIQQGEPQSVDFELVREYARRCRQEWVDAYAILMGYIQRQRPDYRFVLMSLYCFAIAKRMPHLVGVRNPTEIARKLGLGKFVGGSGKATAQKCLDHFISTLQETPLPDQRDAAARRSMSVARKKQVRPHDKH